RVHHRSAGDRGARSTEEVSMATRMLRQGLPRVVGGDPWPPAGDAPVTDAERTDAVADTGIPVAEPVSVAEPVEAPEVPATSNPSIPTPSPAIADAPAGASGARRPGSGVGESLRRGLPRTPGGEPWPPAGAAGAEAGFGSPSLAEPASSPAAEPPALNDPQEVSSTVVERAEGETKRVERAERVETAITTSASSTALRRGLPRTPGGDPWPPAGTAAAAAAPPAAAV